VIIYQTHTHSLRQGAVNNPNLAAKDIHPANVELQASSAQQIDAPARNQVSCVIPRAIPVIHVTISHTVFPFST